MNKIEDKIEKIKFSKYLWIKKFLWYHLTADFSSPRNSVCSKTVRYFSVFFYISKKLSAPSMAIYASLGHVRVWSDLDYYDDLCKEQEISNVKNEITYSLITNVLITDFTTVDKWVHVNQIYIHVTYCLYKWKIIVKK